MVQIRLKTKVKRWVKRLLTSPKERRLHVGTGAYGGQFSATGWSTDPREEDHGCLGLMG